MGDFNLDPARYHRQMAMQHMCSWKNLPLHNLINNDMFDTVDLCHDLDLS